MSCGNIPADTGIAKSFLNERFAFRIESARRLFTGTTSVSGTFLVRSMLLTIE